MRFLLLALAAIPAGAAAQTTTNCTTYIPGQINCTTQGGSPSVVANPNAYGAFINSMPRYTYQGPSIAEAMQQDRLKKATKMIANGDCAGAEQYALRKGDLALAQTVKTYCSQ